VASSRASASVTCARSVSTSRVGVQLVVRFHQFADPAREGAECLRASATWSSRSAGRAIGAIPRSSLKGLTDDAIEVPQVCSPKFPEQCLKSVDRLGKGRTFPGDRMKVPS
jgi:hypothetical protein